MSLYDAFVMAAGKRLAPDQGGGPAKMARGAEGEEGQWSCAACGNVNFAGRLVCNMRKCGAPRPAGDGGVGMAPQQQGVAEDWICPGCGNTNFKGKLFCNMRKCGLAKPGLTANELAMSGKGGMGCMGGMGVPRPMGGFGMPAAGMPPMGVGLAPSGGGKSAPPGSWKCIECGNVNFPTRASCNGRNGQCGKPREMVDGGPPDQPAYMSARPPPGFGFPLTAAAGFGPSAMLGGAAASRPAAPPPEGSWVCAACQNVNFPTRSTCNARACGRPRAEVDGGPPPAAGAAAAAPEGSWTCPSCGNVNFPTRAACNRRACGLPRPAGV